MFVRNDLTKSPLTLRVGSLLSLVLDLLSVRHTCFFPLCSSKVTLEARFSFEDYRVFSKIASCKKNNDNGLSS